MKIHKQEKQGKRTNVEKASETQNRNNNENDEKGHI